jgi:hypothetical protein
MKSERKAGIKDDEEINSIDNLTKNGIGCEWIHKINMWDGRATTFFRISSNSFLSRSYAVT